MQLFPFSKAKPTSGFCFVLQTPIRYKLSLSIYIYICYYSTQHNQIPGKSRGYFYYPGLIHQPHNEPQLPNSSVNSYTRLLSHHLISPTKQPLFSSFLKLYNYMSNADLTDVIKCQVSIDGFSNILYVFYRSFTLYTPVRYPI